MAFGAELKDFVSGFKTGYDMIDSPDDIAFKKERRQWMRDDRDIAADNQKYARGRDAKSDELRDRQWNYSVGRDAKSDAWKDIEHTDKLEEWRLRREELKKAKDDEERKAMGGGPADVQPVTNPNDNPPAAAPATPAPDASSSSSSDSGHGTVNQSYNAVPSGGATVQQASYRPSVYTSGDPTSDILRGPEVAYNMVEDLQRDYGMPKHVAIGITGALAGETGGFTQMQEIDPTVRGSRGGYGYAQWTGPRRNQFEDYAQGNVNSYGKNYGFLRHELDNTNEGSVLAALSNARNSEEAQRIFTDKFLRPGTKNYEGRSIWTNKVASLFGGDGTGTRHLARGGMIEADDPGMGLDQESLAIPDSQSAPAIETADASNSTPPPAAIPDNVPVPTPRPDPNEPDKAVAEEPDDRYGTAAQLKKLNPKDPYDAGKIAVLQGLQASMKAAGLNDPSAINDPEADKRHMAYIRGWGSAPPQVMKQVMDSIDPERKMEPGERNMLALGTVHKYFMDKGDIKSAQEAAASMVQYYRQQSQQYLALGQAALEHGDYDNAVKAAVAAYTNVPNGRDMKVTKGADGNITVSVTDSETGKVVTHKVMKPVDFASQVMQMSPANFDEEILNAAGTKADTYTEPTSEAGAKIDEDTGGKVEELLATDPQAGSLDPKQLSGIKSIASGIARYKENNIGAEDAASLALRMVSSDKDNPESTKAPYTSKPLRDDPNNTVINMDGQKFVIPNNVFTKIESLRQNMLAAKKEEKRAGVEDNWITGTKKGILSEGNQKLASDFMDEAGKWIHSWAPASSPPDQTQAIPDATLNAAKRLGGDAPAAPDDQGGAIPEGPSTPSADSQKAVQTLLDQRKVMVQHKDDPRAQRMIQQIDARLQQLGYTGQ